jgi:hypothetical protein
MRLQFHKDRTQQAVVPILAITIAAHSDATLSEIEEWIRRVVLVNNLKRVFSVGVSWEKDTCQRNSKDRMFIMWSPFQTHKNAS